MSCPNASQILQLCEFLNNFQKFWSDFFEDVEKISSNESVMSDHEQITVDKSTSHVIEALEIYKKMSVNALKAEVVSKGLCSDTSKLKKGDIMKLLEKYHNDQ